MKNKIKDLDEIKIDKNRLKASLNLKNLINIQVLKCYKKLFTKNGLFYNMGSYILLSIIFLYIFSLIYLIFKDYSFLKNEIINLFKFSINNNEEGNNTNYTKSSNELIISREIGKDFFSRYPPIYKQISNKNEKIKRDKKIIEKIKKKPNYAINEVITQNYNCKKIKNKNQEFSFINEMLLNDSPYKKALIYDKRTFCQYFFSLLKSEHLLFFAIIPSKDYNSRAIKISFTYFHLLCSLQIMQFL